MVSERTGISRAQISLIENGKVDPRMSTVLKLLRCYGASLGDLSPAPTQTYSMEEILARAEDGRSRLTSIGLRPADPLARLDRKDDRGIDTSAEREAYASRN